MTNAIRGEAELVAAGKSYRLLLTLGALAEIEDGLGLDDLSQIAERLRHLRASDLAIVVAALLRGGGADVTVADVLRLPCAVAELAAAATTAFARSGMPYAEERDGPFAGSDCLSKGYAT